MKSSEITADAQKAMDLHHFYLTQATKEIAAKQVWLKTYIECLDTAIEQNNAHKMGEYMKAIKETANEIAYFARKAADHATHLESLRRSWNLA